MFLTLEERIAASELSFWDLAGPVWCFHCHFKPGPRPLLLPRALGHSVPASNANLQTDANLDAQVTFCHADSTPKNTVPSLYLQGPTLSSLRCSTILPPVPSSSAIL